MILQRTAKAQLELQPGSRQLPQRSRSVLLMAGGKSMNDLRAMLGSDHAALAQQLVSQGYLQLITATSKESPSASRTPRVDLVSPGLQTPQAFAANTSSVNMAGTRMYMFDLCERLFANRHATLAQTLRDQLREAREPAALCAAGLALLAAVEEYAGKERAQALRERLGDLLTLNEPELAMR